MAQQPFNTTASSSLGEAEQALKSWGIKYEKNWNGTLFVPGDLNISGKGLTRLPDLSKVTVDGDFNCANNRLTTLKGAPQTIGLFQPTPREQALYALSGKKVGSFICSNNQLTSLEHAPRTIRGDFYCHNNQLTSLEHAPHTVGGSFTCANNQLTSLEHAPAQFTCLYSDFGTFLGQKPAPEMSRGKPAATTSSPR